MKTTPNNIATLNANQVFVFGSNLAGEHAGGAARFAEQKFGAVAGNPIGLQGQSYAIPTMNERYIPLEPDDIAKHVAEFYAFASENPGLEFLVTAIGCGIAGYAHEVIAPLFAAARELPNVALPAEFHRVIMEAQG